MSAVDWTHTKEGKPRRRLRDAHVMDRILFHSEVFGGGPANCWLFRGALNAWGYGTIRTSRGSSLVHRVSYEQFNGPIPEGLEIDHLCRVRNCFNPLHLEAVDKRTNIERGMRNQNYGKTHCVHGHEFDEANTYLTKVGKRACRACARDRSRRV